MRIGGHDVVALVKRTGREMGRDKIPVYASQMAYSFFFSLFPLLLFVAALLSIVLDRDTVVRMIEGQLIMALPSGVAGLVRSTARNVLDAPGAPGLLSFGVVTAAWSGSAILGTFMSGLNAAHGVEESRPWWRRQAIRLGMLVVTAVVLLAATIVLLNGEGVVSWLADRVGLGRAGELAWTILQFPLAIAAVVALLFSLYLVLPNVKGQRKRYVLVAALVATVLWVAATLLFRIYVQRFHTLNEAYGAIGAVMVLLTWMYYSSFVLLGAGELNAELQGAKARRGDADARAGRRRPTEERGRRQALTASAHGAGADGRRGMATRVGRAIGVTVAAVRREVGVAQRELGDAVRGLGVGTILVSTGVVLGLLGAISLITGLIALVGDQWLPADAFWAAALVVTVASAAGAWLAMGKGRRFLQQASPVAPMAADEARRTVAELKDAASRGPGSA